MTAGLERSTSAFVYERATHALAMDQIHRLNYETFVEEIPQHPRNGHGVLVDRFDDENTYFVCRHGHRVIGMLAVRGTRPFSLDEKLDNLDAYLPAGVLPCEVRLLAIAREHRHGTVLRGLVREAAEFALNAGYRVAVISGRVANVKLYERLGFRSFGPRVGTDAAPYQPMYVTLERFLDAAGALVFAHRDAEERTVALQFLPGPVDVHDDVRTAGNAPARSHRDPGYVADVRATREQLCAFVNASNVQVLVGTGTLANDAVAAQLGLIGGTGLVFSNGEFGDRLVDHATRAGLRFDQVRVDEPAAMDAGTIEDAFREHPNAAWCWMVHHETSTGVLNDLPALVSVARARGCVVAADCVSSIGVVPVDLSGVDFATGVSGKGLASLSGLAFVFHSRPVAATPRLPRYLDLSLYENANSVPFTQPSGLIDALAVAVRRASVGNRLTERRALGDRLRGRLRSIGLEPLAADDVSCSAVQTIPLGHAIDSTTVGEALRRRGIAIAYQTAYLRRRNWLQIAVMGETTRASIDVLVDALEGVLRQLAQLSLEKSSLGVISSERKG